MATKRNLAPRTPIAVEPRTLSQRTCEAVVGLPPRAYLETARKHRSELQPAKVGQLVIVRVDRWLALMDRLAAGEGPPRDDDVVVDVPTVDEPTSPDDVLARLGLERRAS